jgi:gas vesicle protein
MKAVKFLFGLMLGAVVGWIVGTMFAPQAGEETRLTVRDRVNQIAEEGRSAAEQRVTELRAEFETAKSPRPADAA